MKGICWKLNWFPAVYRSYRNTGIPAKTARTTGMSGNNPHTLYTGINGIEFLYTVGNPKVKPGSSKIFAIVNEVQ